MHPGLQRLVYESHDPAGWLLSAANLRAAAKRLDWLERPPAEDEPLSFVGEYRLLMGLSFENLLKGIIVAQRLRRAATASFRDIYHHKLSKLVNEIDPVQFKLSPDEVATLDKLTAYIEWRGRYPMPKEAKELMCRSHSSDEHAREIALWQRMFAYLKQIAWMSKGVPGQEGWFWLLTR
jgi:hypothetical protein